MQNVQVNQNVNAANFLLVSSRTGSQTSVKGDTDTSVNFANVLQSTNEQQKGNSSVTFTDVKSDTKVSSKNHAKKDDVSISSDEAVDNEKTDASKKTEESVDSISDETQVTEKETADVSKMESVDVEPEKVVEESAMIQVIENMESISEEDMAVILETIGNLLADVMQQFSVNLEELAVKLKEFGMEPADLLTQQGLKEFFLHMNQAEVSDLIVDENLNEELQAFLIEVSDEVDTLETMIPDREAFISQNEISYMLSEITASQEELVVAQPIVGPDKKDVVTDEPEVVIHNDELEVANNVNNVSKNGDTTDTSESNDRQLNESFQQNTTQESVATTESVIVKQNTFTNPILQAIQNAMNNVEVVPVSEQPIQQADILRQIVEQVRVNMNLQQTSLELQLYPEHLGRIQINVVAKEGVMTASIVAETESAKQAIEAGLLNLREAMDQQELKVESIEVMVSTTAFESKGGQEQSFDEKGSSNPRRKIDISELDEEITVEDEAEVEKMKVSGSSVSYRA